MGIAVAIRDTSLQSIEASVARWFNETLEMFSRYPPAYISFVLVQGFRNYCSIPNEFGRNLFEHLGERLNQKLNPYDPTNPRHRELRLRYLRRAYSNWVEINKLNKGLKQAGWEAYVKECSP